MMTMGFATIVLLFSMFVLITNYVWNKNMQSVMNGFLKEVRDANVLQEEQVSDVEEDVEMVYDEESMQIKRVLPKQQPELKDR